MTDDLDGERSGAKRDRLARFYRVLRVLESHGRAGAGVTPEEIARLLGLARKKLPIIKKAIHVHQAAPQTEQAEGWSLGELIRDDNARCPAEVLLDANTLRHVLRRIDQLADRTVAMADVVTLDQQAAAPLRSGALQRSGSNR